MWEYRAKLIRVVDGDTVDVLLDLGFDVHMRCRVRLRNINAPDRGEPGFVGAQEAVVRWMLKATGYGQDHRWPLVVRTYQAAPRDRWGRWVADVYNADNDLLNVWLVDHGFAQVSVL